MNEPQKPGGITAYRLAGNLRFLTTVFVGVLLLVTWISLVTFINNRIPGGIGLFLALAGGSSLFFGLWLAYQNLVDWSNLAIIKRFLNNTKPELPDGQVIAFEGQVVSDQSPITSPFTNTPCAAYSYEVFGSRHSNHRSSTTVTLAAGHHLLPTWVAGNCHKLRLYAFPGLEDDLRKNLDGRDFADQLDALFQRRVSVRYSGERDRTAAMMQAREGWAEELHRDFRMGEYGGNPSSLSLTEEVLPMGETVCVTGTYDADQGGITALQERIGPNLMVYRGSAQEVLARVGGENRKYFRIAGYMVGFGVLVSLLALWSPDWPTM